MCYSRCAHRDTPPLRLHLLAEILSVRADTRRCRRIRFADPLPARFAGRLVRLRDLSTLGARIEHSFPLAIGSTRLLEFELDCERLSLEARVVRARLEHVDGAARFCSGILFLVDPAASDILWGLLASLRIAELRQPDIVLEHGTSVPLALDGTKTAASRRPPK